jgi:hypothetical protein
VIQFAPRLLKVDQDSLHRILHEDIANLRRRASPSFPLLTPAKSILDGMDGMDAMGGLNSPLNSPSVSPARAKATSAMGQATGQGQTQGLDLELSPAIPAIRIAQMDLHSYQGIGTPLTARANDLPHVLHVPEGGDKAEADKADGVRSAGIEGVEGAQSTAQAGV